MKKSTRRRGIASKLLFFQTEKFVWVNTLCWEMVLKTFSRLFEMLSYGSIFMQDQYIWQISLQNFVSFLEIYDTPSQQL